MEQRESLKRQIELLQSLIDQHKSVHGNAPRLPEVATTSGGRGRSASAMNPPSSYAGPSHASWRKTYSLKNKNPASTGSSAERHSDSQVSSRRAPPPAIPGEKCGTSEPSASSSKIAPHEEKGQRETPNVATERSGACKKAAAGAQSVPVVQRRHQGLVEDSSERHPSAKACTPTAGSVIPRWQNPPYVKSQTDSADARQPDSRQTIGRGSGSSPHASPSKFKNLPLSQSGQAAGRQPQSKFTWVRSQTCQTGPRSSVDSQANQDVKVDSPLGAKASALSAISPPVGKRTPGKKSRKASPVIAGPRTSKYKWVSSSARVQAKNLRKSSSPKALSGEQRAAEKGEALKKLQPGSFTSTKVKRGFATSSASSSSSRYHWKAGAPGSPLAGARREAAALRRSSFVWASEKNNRGAKKGLAYSGLPQGYCVQSSPSSFKLRSRMKIIRRSATGPNGNGSPKGGLLLAAKHSTRGHVHNLARRTPARELVSFGRHKLRRLSPTSSRTSAAFSFHRPPASPRIFRWQDKPTGHACPPAAYALPCRHALSWRAKKIQSARSFLQSRQRSSLHRYPPPAGHREVSAMCWIRGHLYQVSANRLSRSVCRHASVNRTGRSFSQVSSFAGNHPSSPRHFASRAVQRSLAIIRQARQRKQRQYCMYYNRFGKCNRGGGCPYIHDPDKVAVCTRFLRGTCKQADGACPFSHRVAKEKMPVCSYFLKGICNNADCPYSHVYVSRKAKVCEDFVKGYCPEGEKCKKKHTLVCADFSKTGSCPRGARCKLQHRQRAKRSASAPDPQPPERPRPSALLARGSRDAPDAPAASSLALPSFISLSSSPEEADAPEPRLIKNAPSKEKKLQIKPRLEEPQRRAAPGEKKTSSL
ncbi:zinc finger CCCH domain-containing protein 3 isoform X3 [Hippocampus zosterae]|uniref:zinc finger CCCH domain-containing protein 3 isoform X3 n=1 Tax=Hippocampus zosterae TaxID=109293 RepID=UPI00223D8CAE|nr:zinc finger CCCH domain-containing protein 3 isoform X3 [Hippocampus zosterae]